MSGYFLTGKNENGSELVIAAITADIALAHNIDRAESLGYFLYQKSSDSVVDDVNILAKLSSEEAAFALSKILGLN